MSYYDRNDFMIDDAEEMRSIMGLTKKPRRKNQINCWFPNCDCAAKDNCGVVALRKKVRAYEILARTVIVLVATGIGGLVVWLIIQK